MKYTSTISDQAEIEKCRKEPWYFYNTYTNYGRRNPITKEDWELLTSQCFAYVKAKRYDYVGSLLKRLKEDDRK